MKVALSLLMCISFTAIAMRHAPLRAMGTRSGVPGPRQPAKRTAKPAAAPAPVREEFLTNLQKHYLMEVAAADWGTFNSEQREKVIEAFKTLPLSENKNNPVYNRALMTLARNSARFTNLGEELPLAEVLIEAGANINYEVQAPEWDELGSSASDARGPQRYNRETIWQYATGDFKEMLTEHTAKNPKF